MKKSKKIIIITGSIATGKTALAKKLAKSKNYRRIDINHLIKKHKLSEGMDKKRKAKIIDTKKLNKVLIKIINDFKKTGTEKGLIIDSHLSHYLPKKYVDLCIVTKTPLKKLKRRLEKRHYSKKKVRENLDAEIFDVCLEEAKERSHHIKIVNN